MTPLPDGPTSTDSHPRIDRLWPDPATDLDDEALLATYATPSVPNPSDPDALPDLPTQPARPWLRMNVIASLDGAATRDGRSGGLGDAADRRVFDLLRRLADAVIVGAGTVRDEGYGGLRLDPGAVSWREAHGLARQPTFVLVSRSLDLDPTSAVFTQAPVRPIIYTVPGADAARWAALAEVADVVAAGSVDGVDVDPSWVRADLAGRGLVRLHSEGGPSLFGSFLAAGAVDELCLTVAPTLEAGDAGRISHAHRPARTGMALAAVLRADDELFLRYVRVDKQPILCSGPSHLT
ncbi:MAG: pyrimidine reductase family protein [Actinobacteria bacterium]|nr:pyrimidine reductase family protein [Actinomycetota bacterium]